MIWLAEPSASPARSSSRTLYISVSVKLGGVGKWKRLEAACLVVAGAIFEGTAGRERPCDMNSTGENAQDEGVAGGDVDEHIVREDGRIEKHKESMFGGFHGRNIAPE